MDAIRRARRPPRNAAQLTDECRRLLDEHRAYIATHFEDLPEIRDWTWRP
jgi:xylulose-5-phosphate/fructose-6-phosphate phosphoketolase